MSEFDKWLRSVDERPDTRDFSEREMRGCWNAAVAEAGRIAWEQARGIRKPSGRQTECDDVADAIAKLAAPTSPAPR